MRNTPALILIADDEIDNREMLTRRLRRRNYAVIEAVDGAEAVRLAGAQPIDLIVMDVSMPRMDGFMATRAIRAMEDGAPRRTPIIALTAHAMLSTETACREAGCDAFATKPVDFAALSAQIEALTAPGR